MLGLLSVLLLAAGLPMLQGIENDALTTVKSYHIHIFKGGEYIFKQSGMIAKGWLGRYSQEDHFSIAYTKRKPLPYNIFC